MFRIGNPSSKSRPPGNGRPENAESSRRSPSLIRFLAINAAIGATVAVLVVAGLIVSDTHALGHLIMGDESPVVAVLLLVFGFVITLGSAAMGAAIMGLPYGEGGGRAGRKAVRNPAPIDDGRLVPAKAGAAARR